MQVAQLLGSYLSAYQLHPSFDEEEVAHWLLPRPDVMNSYVVQGSDGAITDMLSFYTLPSTVIGHNTYMTLKVGSVTMQSINSPAHSPRRKLTRTCLAFAGRVHVLHRAGGNAAAAAHERCAHHGPRHWP